MSKRLSLLKMMKQAISLSHTLSEEADKLNDEDAKWVERKLKKWCKTMGYKVDDEHPKQKQPAPFLLADDDLPF